MDPFERIAEEAERHSGDKTTVSDFYLFEPWDVEKRPDWMIEQAMADGVDLHSGDITRHLGKDPHPFQTGYLLSKRPFRMSIAGTQSGKSFGVLYDMLIMATGEIPFSMRYDAGMDTGIKRPVNQFNIRRFGRRDAITGEFIDKNSDHPLSPDEWNCGNVMGVGKYPKEKIAPPGNQFWIGTWMKAMHVYWWPKLAETATRITPDHLIDKRRGADGVRKDPPQLFLVNDQVLSVITYESGYERFEAAKAWSCALDEEPKDPRIVNAAMTHCFYLSLSETPYQGITYTRDYVFSEDKAGGAEVFHATQYDSPNQVREDVDRMRGLMPEWEVKPRVYGIHSEVRGKPYYNRHKLMKWLSTYPDTAYYRSLHPNDSYVGVKPQIPDVKCLMDVDVRFEKEASQDDRSFWKIYEEPVAGVAYVAAVDTAEGSEDPNEAGDFNACLITRPGKENKPFIVASIRSTLPTAQFADMVGLAVRKYNNALLAAETKRGFTNATFAQVLMDYPHWYKMTVVKDATRKQVQIKGFDTNERTRPHLFDYIGEWIDSYSEDEYPQIPDRDLMLELAAAVVGKGGRCDHQSDGHLDLGICFGITLYIYKHSENQIKFRGDEEDIPVEKRSFLETLLASKEAAQSSGYLGDVRTSWR